MWIKKVLHKINRNWQQKKNGPKKVEKRKKPIYAPIMDPWWVMKARFFSCVSFSVPLLPALHYGGPGELRADSAGSGPGRRGAYRKQEAALPAGPTPLLPLPAPPHSGGCWVLYACPLVFRQPGCHFDVCSGGDSVERLLYRVLSLWREAGRFHW